MANVCNIFTILDERNQTKTNTCRLVFVIFTIDDRSKPKNKSPATRGGGFRRKQKAPAARGGLTRNKSACG